MVDLRKPCENYTLEDFTLLEKEVALFPHFKKLQEKFYATGVLLNVTSSEFNDFKESWQNAQLHIFKTNNPDSKVIEPCGQKERQELIDDFILNPIIFKNPKEVFSKF